MTPDRIIARDGAPRPLDAAKLARPQRPDFLPGAEHRLASRKMFSSVRTVKGQGARSSAADRGLAATGVAAAMMAASFAGYMIAKESSPESFKAEGHGRLLAPAPGPSDSKPDAGARGAPRPFDFDATGSIVQGSGDVAEGAPLDVQSAVKTSRAQPGPAGGAAGYVLRFVHKGVAIVQIAGKSYVVAPGAALPQAGRVLSIERRAGRWVVVTAAGLIVEAP